MAEPWLAIIGLGEDGPAGLPEASRAALARAEIVFGAPRHLALAGLAGRGPGETGAPGTGAAQTRAGPAGTGPAGTEQAGTEQAELGPAGQKWPQTGAEQAGAAQTGAAQTGAGQAEPGQRGMGPAEQARAAQTGPGQTGPGQARAGQAGAAPGAGRGREWPVPFAIAPLLALRGQRVAALVSGDPFWHGAGARLAEALAPGEWRAYPVAGSFSLAAARLGWRIEETACLGLHAAPFARLRPVLARGARAICLMRDAEAPEALARWLVEAGLGRTRMVVMEALGGPRERLRHTRAEAFDLPGGPPLAPVAVALDGADLPAGSGLPRGFGLPEELFAHDGQITRRRIRAITLAALAPRAGELLWDIGAGSGSVSVEWCLAGGRAIAIEPRPDRLANIARNIAAFGLGGRMQAVAGAAPAALAGLAAPDAIFLGGGADHALVAALPAARIVANAVTLETEALLAGLHAARGGSLCRIAIDEAAPLGRMRGWVPARPVTQWSWP